MGIAGLGDVSGGSKGRVGEWDVVCEYWSLVLGRSADSAS